MSFTQKIKAAVQVFFAVSLVLFFVKLAYYHYQVVVCPYQLEYREGGILLTTDFMLKGGNPYDLAHQPQYANVYGIFYHWIVYPFVRVFGPTLLVHRAVTAFFIFASCLMIFGVMRREKISRMFVFSAVLLFYFSMIAPNTSTPLAGPHSLGVFLFLGSIFWPFLAQYSLKSLMGSIVLADMAFFTKSYFVLGVPYLASYIFLFVSKRKGVAYAGLFFILLLVSIVTVNFFYPTHFNSTILSHIERAGYVLNHVHRQFSSFIEFYSGILLGFLTVAFLHGVKDWERIKKGLNPSHWKLPKVHVLEFPKPLVDLNLHLMVFCFLCSMLLIYFKLGGHGGSWLAYLYQLITPFLVVVIFLGAKKGKVLNLIWIPFIVMNLYTLTFNAFPVIEMRSKEWEDVRRILASHQNIFNTPAIVSLLLEQKKEVFDSGHTEDFLSGTTRNPLLKKIAIPNRQIVTTYFQYLKNISDAIKVRKYDLIVLTKDWSPMVFKELVENYALIGVIPVKMSHSRQSWDITFWKSKQ